MRKLTDAEKEWVKILGFVPQAGRLNVLSRQAKPTAAWVRNLLLNQ
jgi:hypothetical protein